MQLKAWVVHEFLALHSYLGQIFPKVEFYRGSKGGLIDIVLVDEHDLPTLALKIFPYETFVHQDFEILRAFQKKHPSCHCLALGSERLDKKEFGIAMLPWENLI